MNAAVRLPTPVAPYPAVRISQVPRTAREAVVQGVLYKGSVNGCIGQPGSGKSALVLDLALNLACRSERWFGFKVRGGPVVYVAAEASASSTTRASAALDRVYSGRPASLFIVGDAPELGSEALSAIATERLLATIRTAEVEEGESVVLVVIDTLAAVLAGGSENGDGMVAVMAAATRIAKETGAAVIVVHHPSKNDSDHGRGHTSFRGTADTIILVDADPNSGIRTATVTKNRDGVEGLKWAYLLETIVLDEPDSFGDPATTVLVKPAAMSATRRRRPNGPRQEQLLTELERRFRAGETVWTRAEVTTAAKGLGMHRNSAAVALDGLIHADYVAGSDAQLILKFPPDLNP